MAGTTTANAVFQAAIALMGELSSTGAADISDNTEYKHRTLPILNILMGELFPLSDTYTVETGGIRPIATIITDMASAIEIDDVIARTIMPYGLAAMLLLDENPAMAGFFQQKYEELRTRLANTPAEFEPIQSVYGGTEYSAFSRW